MFIRLLKLRFVPSSTDLALLVLRVCAGVSLFLRHGWEKATGFDGVVARVPDILHIGVVPMIFLAAIGDVLCSLLVAVGLATRWAAAYSFAVIFVAWSMREHFNYFEHGRQQGEMMVLYLIAMLTIFLAGPGRFSLDALFKEKDPAASK
jgi:putative oxidoreductase